MASGRGARDPQDAQSRDTDESDLTASAWRAPRGPGSPHKRRRTAATMRVAAVRARGPHSVAGQVALIEPRTIPPIFLCKHTQWSVSRYQGRAGRGDLRSHADFAALSVARVGMRDILAHEQ